MSDLVGNPEDWFSHNEAQFILSPYMVIHTVHVVCKKGKKHTRDQTGTEVLFQVPSICNGCLTFRQKPFRLLHDHFTD